MPLIKPGKANTKKKMGRRKARASTTSPEGALKDLFVSQVRVDMLKLFMLNPKAKFHVRAITRKVGAEINAVRRELENLVKLGLLAREQFKNRLNYFPHEHFPFFDEVLGMVVKEEGLGKALISSRGIGELKFGFVSVPFLRGRVAGPNDIDLLLVGRLSMRKVSDLVEEEEKRRGQEINYAVLTEGEFEALKKRRDPLIIGALLQPKVLLTQGSESYLAL